MDDTAKEINGKVMVSKVNVDFNNEELNDEFNNGMDGEFNEEMQMPSRGNFMTNIAGPLEITISLIVALALGITLGVLWSKKVIRKINLDNNAD